MSSQTPGYVYIFLERALILAEPQGYVHIFVSEGQPMAKLLAETAIQEISPDYARKLLAEGFSNRKIAE